MKTVIILGLKNSGSGCVHDYLSNRVDFMSPFGNNEFKLCSDPMGIHNIYINCYKNFSFFNPSNSMNDFLDYIKKYQDFIVYPTYGNGEKLFKKEILTLSKNYINKITKVLYYGNPEFSNFKINKLQNFYLRLKKTKTHFYPIRLPVDEKKFLKETRNYINQIILKNSDMKKISKNQNVVLNQSSNVFDPIRSSQYFEKARTIIITRDPRDIFASMKKRKSKGAPSYDVNIFCDWFLACFNNKNFEILLKNKSILIIKFESFVNNFKRENERLCKFLNISQKFILRKNSDIEFDLQKSKKNIYKSKKNLTNFEYRLIKNKLKDYLHW